ncbi:MAG: single-stranded DNA-binding protein [Clostridia bacterium]|nr:single-stranded DNA-binding protein [Clostridia bacterium]
MSYDQLENNKVYLSGTVAGSPEFSHEVMGEGFYDLTLDVQRLSGQADRIPLTISERLMGDVSLETGEKIGVYGQLRSYNKVVGERSKLVLKVFVRELGIGDDQNPNYIDIEGFVCKPTVYRTTPFGREICDVLLAVNRAYNKSDYIPCIAWGRNARYAQSFEVGDKVLISGRIQSREYQKALDDGSYESRTAYEVSINKIEKTI